MTLSLMGRWTLAFWLEAMLMGVCLILFGYMTAGFGQLLTFCLAAAILLLAGSWLHYGGGGRFMLHLLLYPLVFFIGMGSFYLYDSWLIALVLAAVYFWRVQSAASEGYRHDSLQRRFVLALMAGLIQLVIAVLYTSIVDPGSYSLGASFSMLVLITLSYMLVAIGAFVLREGSLSTRLPARIRLLLGSQVLGTRIFLIAGYLAVSSIVLSLIYWIWSWIKGPVSAALYTLFEPVLIFIVKLFEHLYERANQKQAAIKLVTDSTGQKPDNPSVQVQLGESLFSVLQPYLIIAFILACVILLGRYIWKKRFKGSISLEKEVAAAQNTILTTVPPSTSEESAEDGSAKWFKQPVGPEDDPTRYAYYQFLVLMEKRGVPIKLHETPQEFFNRLREQPLLDAGQLDAVARITRYYQQYRYQEQSLPEADLTAMQQAVQMLGSRFSET
ncbi:DUF4129 domain-containing protein [Brevibacillus antibioticus]|uniref:DUF4129 domain-containing protein n=1 Tax=Brevibacillus antibioticus TaxID=2570228 RepID=A0A4U2YCA7_9BACL|nr:DUF4129 domain-containing protein [Brevibacillus antibioticus]TKI57682.1 DUF4129 domain-containing protein [Brevibacillus antibioticus]